MKVFLVLLFGISCLVKTNKVAGEYTNVTVKGYVMNNGNAAKWDSKFEILDSAEYSGLERDICKNFNTSGLVQVKSCNLYRVTDYPFKAELNTVIKSYGSVSHWAPHRALMLKIEIEAMSNRASYYLAYSTAEIDSKVEMTTIFVAGIVYLNGSVTALRSTFFDLHSDKFFHLESDLCGYMRKILNGSAELKACDLYSIAAQPFLANVSIGIKDAIKGNILNDLQMLLDNETSLHTNKYYLRDMKVEGSSKPNFTRLLVEGSVYRDGKRLASNPYYLNATGHAHQVLISKVNRMFNGWKAKWIDVTMPRRTSWAINIDTMVMADVDGQYMRDMKESPHLFKNFNHAEYSFYLNEMKITQYILVEGLVYKKEEFAEVVTAEEWQSKYPLLNASEELCHNLIGILKDADALECKMHSFVEKPPFASLMLNVDNTTFKNNPEELQRILDSTNMHSSNSRHIKDFKVEGSSKPKFTTVKINTDLFAKPGTLKEAESLNFKLQTTIEEIFKEHGIFPKWLNVTTRPGIIHTMQITAVVANKNNHEFLQKLRYSLEASNHAKFYNKLEETTDLQGTAAPTLSEGRSSLSYL